MSTDNLAQRPNVEQRHEVPLEEALELAQGHHRSGNFVLAERTYRDILRTVPGHFPTTHLLGALLFACEHYDEAKEYFAQALEEEPDNPSVINNHAATFLQQEDFDEAIKWLDRALEVQPGYIDAVSNKCYALWHAGRFEDAEKEAKHLIELAPENTMGWNTLGIALSNQYRYEEAFDAWEKALEINPEEAVAMGNWGNALRDVGRLDEAYKKCKAAYERDDEDPIILNNYGNILRDKGSIDEAIEIYKKAAGIKPSYAEVHSNLSIAYYDNGLFHDAVVAARYALAFNSRLYQAYTNLSAAQYKLGNLSESHTAAHAAVRYAPDDNAEVFIALAEILEGIDQYDDAEAAITEALRREPESARAYIKMSEIRQAMNRYEEAHAAIDRALELSPQMPKTQLAKGMLLFHQQRPEEGLKFIEEAIALAPDWIYPHLQKAEVLASVGDFDQVEEVISSILEKDKNIPAVYNVLANTKGFESADDPMFLRMLDFEKTIATYGVQIESSFYLCLASAYDKFKDYERAGEYLIKGNDAKKQTISYENALENQVAGIELRTQTFVPKMFEAGEGLGSKSAEPIFIVGMPRSGTTLTEQIISSHPDVTPGGELTFITSVVKQIPFSLDTLEQAGDLYVEMAKAFIGGDMKTPHFTDKMPGNSMLIGYIKMILPNAKIIYCNRNPIDNCVSCYQQNFYMGHYWSYDQEALGQYYLNHDGMMNHWREVLPDGFLEVNYEDTVGDLETQARKIIDYLGLEWNDACLEPHKLKRAVMTASRAQVTKPVYKTSVEKWRRYEKHIQPLVRKLAPDKALPEEKEA